MTDRRAVVRTLDKISFGVGLTGGRSAKTYAFAARTLQRVEGDIHDLFESGALAELKGIGPSVLEVVGDVLAGRVPDRLAKVEAEVPEGLFELRRVRGLGASKIATLWQELGVTNLADLEYACTENRLVDLPGFGAKSQATIFAALERVLMDRGRFRRDQITAAIDALLPDLDAHPGIARHRVVGEFRRGYELVNDGLQVVVAGDGLTADAVAEALDGKVGPMGRVSLVVEGVQTTLIVGDRVAGFGGLCVLHTGSEEHVQALRDGAAEDGLYFDEIVEHAAEEGSLYATLGLDTPAAERREAGVVVAPRGRRGPALVHLVDLQGALHNHTTASDGRDSLETMQAAAAELGLRYLGISEHSQSAHYAGGLDPDALTQQREAIARANAACVLLAGVESDILADGSLDYDESSLANLDFVVASVHQRHGQGGEEMTQRMVAAAHHPYADVIGHPTGRLLLGRPPTDLDVERLIDACAASGCAVELNASPHRLDLDARALAIAKERGVLVSIAADAHSAGALRNLEYGIAVARRAGLTPQDVLNCLPLDLLRAWLEARRQRALASSPRPGSPA